MAVAWNEIKGTRIINTGNESFVDVQIDFEAAVATDLPARGATYPTVKGSGTDSLIPANHTCTEPEVVQIRRHHRSTPTKSRVTILFRGTVTGA